MKKNKQDPRRRLKSRLLANIKRLPPLLTLRIILTWLLFSPLFFVLLFFSWIKMRKWRHEKACKAFLVRHALAFENVDPSSLRLESLKGGLSNSNQFWHCKTFDGKEISYFVKVFVSIGSFWAKNLSLVSPFPVVYGVSTRERFSVDMVTRVSFRDLGIDVPALVAFDAVEQVMVTEFIQGENVDDALIKISAQEKLESQDETMIRECAVGLARIHRHGYSLIDTQPVNCLWIPEQKRVYFTDLEFCTREDKRTWDVGFFMCFLAIRLPKNLRDDAQRLFLKSYEIERGTELSEVDITAKEMKAYLPIFKTILDIRQFTPEELFSELMSPDLES